MAQATFRLVQISSHSHQVCHTYNTHMLVAQNAFYMPLKYIYRILSVQTTNAIYVCALYIYD
jgi:hypothetical protein